MSIPKLRFKGFSDKWISKSVADYVNINPKTGKMPDSFIYIDLESVKSGALLKENEIRLSEAPSRAQRVLSKGDILFQMVRPYQGNNLLFEKEGIYVASTGYAQIKTNESNQFFYQLFHTKKFLDEVMDRCTGTSYPAIDSKSLGGIKVSAPGMAEQQKIASFLAKFDQKISLLSKKHELLIQYKKGVMQKIFNQEIRFKDENGDEFVDWGIKRFDDVVQIQGGFAFKSSNFGSGETKVLKIGDIGPSISLVNFTGETSTENPDERFSVRKGDYLMALSGATFGKVGKIADKGVAYINQRVATFRTKQVPAFFYQYIQTESFKSYIKSIPSASAQPNISNSDIGSYIAPVPSIEEQKKIADFLNSVDVLIEVIERKMKLTKQYKLGLLQQMFI